jgi:alpha-L-fucosidase
MDCYYKSVGYGSVFLLNSTPDTTGLIPEADRILYKKFGDEIDSRFKTPLASVNNQKGEIVTLNFSENTKINHVVTMEDYRLGHRIREYNIEGFVDGKWKVLCSGQSVGRKKIDYFDEVNVSKMRLNVSKSANEPVIRSLSAYFVAGFVPPKKHGISPWSEWQNLVGWELEKGTDITIELNLSGKIKLPGQFTVKIEPENTEAKIKISNLELLYDGRVVLDDFTSVKGNEININRTDQVTDESKIVLRFKLNSETTGKGKITFKPALIY